LTNRRSGRSLGRRASPRRRARPWHPTMTAIVPNRRRWRIAIALLAFCSPVFFAHADTLVTDGVEPWAMCAECHSLDGISAMARFPKLAGQRPDYIMKQVRDFRDGRRRTDGGQMTAVAAEINDADLAKTAAYFAGLPPPPPDSSLSAESDE